MGDHPVCIKFGRPVQNHMPMTVKRSKWKPEVEFQYDGRLFSKTKNSNISAADWATLSKFGTERDFYVLNCGTWAKRKPEVDLRRCGRHLKNGYDVITRPDNIRYADRKSHADDDGNVKVEPDIEFQYGGRLFSETGNSNISAADWAVLTKFGMQIVSDVLKCYPSPKLKPELDLRCCGRHLRRSTLHHNSIIYRLIRIKFVGRCRIICW